MHNPTRKLALTLVVALSLGGCANGQIKNPITATQLYQAEIVFDGSIKAFNSLKDLCARRVLKPTCRTYVIRGQRVIAKAYAAEKAARNFVDNNPTIDATNVVQAFQGLLADFNSTVTALGATQ